MEYHLLSVKLETNKKTPGGGVKFLLVYIFLRGRVDTFV